MRIERNKHIVEITVPASGIVLRAQEGSENMYASIDNCVEKIERQIHKYKTRLMKRKYNNFRDAAVPPVSGDVEEASADGEFKVARTKTYAMRPMNVQEAIMQMNMLNHDFFVFFNDETESMAVSSSSMTKRNPWPLCTAVKPVTMVSSIRNLSNQKTCRLRAACFFLGAVLTSPKIGLD